MGGENGISFALHVRVIHDHLDTCAFSIFSLHPLDAPICHPCSILIGTTDSNLHKELRLPISFIFVLSPCLFTGINSNNQISKLVEPYLHFSPIKRKKN